LNSSEGPSLTRGRIPAEQRALILQMHAANQSVDAIAAHFGRSVEAVRKLVESQEVRPDAEAETGWALDEILDFLAELPDQALTELTELARIQRQADQLRGRLALRLKGR